MVIIFTVFNLYADTSIGELSIKISQLEKDINLLNGDISNLKTKQIFLILGLLIAFASLYLSWKKEKLNVSVIPISMYNNNGLIYSNKNSFDKVKSENYFGINVINSSSFPIDVLAVGAKLKPNKHILIFDINCLYEPIEFPFRIESKTSKVFKIRLASIQDKNINKIFIQLSTGEQIEGKSKALDNLIKTL